MKMKVLEKRTMEWTILNIRIKTNNRTGPGMEDISTTIIRKDNITRIKNRMVTMGRNDKVDQMVCQYSEDRRKDMNMAPAEKCGKN